MKPGWLTLALGVGLIIPLQQAMNAKMRTFVVNPMYASLVNFFVGAAFGIVVAALMSASGEPGSWRRATDAPWWAWCGGLIGMAFITAGVLCVPRIGVASFSAAVLVGQLLGAMALDHLGWMGVIQRQVTATRMVGVGLLLLGASRKRASYSKTAGRW